MNKISIKHEGQHTEFRLGDEYIHVSPLLFSAFSATMQEVSWWVWHSDEVSHELLEQTLDYYKDEPDIARTILEKIV
jgi:hypothetical protein